MTKFMIFAGLLGIVLGLAVPSTPANAAAPGFCRDYARAAINQVRGALSKPRCRAGMEGSRWSANERVHYGWCLGASPEAAEEERARRTEHIERCR